MADLWSRVVNTTMHEFIKGAEENILRNRKVLAMLKEKGRITFSHAGDKMDWKIKYKRAPMQGYADADVLTFSRRDRWKTAQIDWRGYASTDSMTKMETLVNKNTEAIVKVYSQIGTSLLEDMEENFGDELYIDGNATGNSKRLHGLESFFGDTGTASTKQPVAVPSDTYAGLTTGPGDYGGSWSNSGTTSHVIGDWPTGTGDAHYDFWSPTIVDYTSGVATSSAAGTTGWAAATKTWPNTCKEALRYGIIKSKKNKSMKGQLDLIMLNDDLYRQFEGKLDDAERMVVKRGDKQGLYALGFTDVINFDGVDISYEYGMPINLGYGWNFQMVELCSLQGSLFVPEGPDFDIATQSYRFSFDFFGNLRCNPRYQTKWLNRT